MIPFALMFLAALGVLAFVFREQIIAGVALAILYFSKDDAPEVPPRTYGSSGHAAHRQNKTPDRDGVRRESAPAAKALLQAFRRNTG